MLKVLDPQTDKVLPAIMLQSTRHIKAGEAVTVNYGELYWEDDWVCKCLECDADKPTPSRRLLTVKPEPRYKGPYDPNYKVKKRTRKRQRRPPVDAEVLLKTFKAHADWDPNDVDGTPLTE